MIRSALGSLLVFSVLGALAPAQELTEKSYRRIRDLVVPRPSECRWERIPWRTTLWDAVREADEKNRPILLWVMNGHPLGCT
jgi:hypothetical protein